MPNFHIPEDLHKELLVRLPVESLLRFKSVCKSWSTLIGSKEFARMQLNRSLMDPKACKVIVRTVDFHEEEWKKTFRLLAAELDSPKDFLASIEEAHHPLQEFEEVPIKLIGSCHGLLCIKNCHDGLFLCNPCIKKHRKLPYFLPGVRIRCPITQYSHGYGFGYDDVNDDYKVVRLHYPRKEVEVYSLKSDSWRKIQNFPVHIPDHSSSGVFANCSLHWLHLVSDVSVCSIVAIDLRIEEHRLLPLPDVAMNHTITNLGVLDGCLMIFSGSAKKTTKIQIWVMNDYGVKDSWTKLINVHLGETVKDTYLHVLRFCQSSEEFIFQHSMKEVVWYDIRNKSVKKAKIPGSERLPKEVYRIVYSLIDPNCRGREGIMLGRE